MKLHEKVVHLRKKKQWSQQDLCDQVGVNITHLSRLENGKSQPSAVLLRKIAQALAVSMDYLMDEDADEVTPVSIKNKSLAKKLELLEHLDQEDQQTIINVIDSMLTKKKMLDLLLKKEQVVTA
jgi:transcriptional regulator with XRE-family HTH domain